MITPHTLIVVHGNQFIDVFSDDHHSLKIVNVPFMASVPGELAIEEMLALRLPPFWAKVYRDGKLVIRESIKDISPADIIQRDNELALVRTMNRLINGQTATVRA